MTIPLHPPVRVHPFTGLVIDVDTWATAHDYHRRQQQLHLLTLHGSGIGYGLDVLPTDPPSDTLIVEAGVAIDALGNVIVVPERQRVTISDGDATSYIVLDYVESIPAASEVKDTRARVVEDFRLRVLQALPEAPALELARVVRSDTSAAIVAAANPWEPKANEVDCRFRIRLTQRGPRPLSVGLVVHGDGADLAGHLAGFQYFLRELEREGVRAATVRASDGNIPSTDLVYLTGPAETALPAALTKRVAERVSKGGWIFADACGPGTQMVQSLTTALKGSHETAARAESLVLTSHYVFGTPPAGAFPTKEIIWAEKALISPRDYGCAWAGRRGDQVFQRDLIRSALEFATNVAFGVLHEVDPR
ncbi:MAG TPA: hypothetical protein VNN10_01490 [Dehalococcoidia bacterium]|nr:hypothetical protein [Dehalococcoidia bacterium]